MNLFAEMCILLLSLFVIYLSLCYRYRYIRVPSEQHVQPDREGKPPVAPGLLPRGEQCGHPERGLPGNTWLTIQTISF